MIYKYVNMDTIGLGKTIKHPFIFDQIHHIGHNMSGKDIFMKIHFLFLVEAIIWLTSKLKLG